MIHTILVPTDFSDCAGYALDAAVQLAERFQARIHLIHCLDLPADWPDRTLAQRQTDTRSQGLIQHALERLEELVARYPAADMEWTYIAGVLPGAIADYADDHGADLVVMGSYGASGKSEFFIGSNTQKVVRILHRPVLVVKKPLESVNFEKVVFASSFNENEREPFLFFKDFVKHFLPELHLVIVHTSSLFNAPYIVSKEAMNDFKKLCGPLECHTHILRDYSIDRAIRSFSEDIGASLIGVSNHHRHPVKRVLVGSNVEALVNHSDLPVLCIDYPKKSVKSNKT